MSSHETPPAVLHFSASHHKRKYSEETMGTEGFHDGTGDGLKAPATELAMEDLTLAMEQAMED
jgi:hypothetical protein